jgi:ribosomal protein S6
MDNTDERKIYEIGYLLAPYLPSEGISGSAETIIKSKIEVAGGEVTSALEPVMTRLAYTITKVINNKHTKFSDAYFGALRFKALGEMVKKLEADWKKDDNIVRFLLITLPKGSENIVAPKRVFARSAGSTSHEDKPFEIERIMPVKEDDKVVLSAEDLDKEIDKLVEPAN